jgi:nucleoside-diphosphate-sugar epimerase
VIARFIEQKLRGKPLTVYGNGRQTRDFIYVSDCARFIVEAGLATGVDGEIINAGSGTSVSIFELAEIISGGSSPITNVPHPHPNSEIYSMRCDSSKAHKLLGWKAKVKLHKGIAVTQRWISAKLSQ